MTRLSVANTLLLSTLLSWGNPLYAQQSGDTSESEPDRWFEIELVVFKHASNSSNEHWTEKLATQQPATTAQYDSDTEFSSPQEKVAADTDPQDNLPMQQLRLANGRPLFDGPTPDNSAEIEYQSAVSNDGWMILPADQRQLKKQATHLKVSKEHKILFHQAWRQPMVSGDKASWIVVHGGEQINDNYALEGSIRFSLKRYLHAKTELAFREFVTTPRDNQITTSDTLNYKVSRTFRLQESRRMRSRELHYIDSPVIGVLIKITPFESDSELIEVIEEPATPGTIPASKAVSEAASEDS